MSKSMTGDVFRDMLSLDQSGKIQVEYVWLGGGGELRGKSRTINGAVSDVSELPKWNYDGSSTGQATGEHSEIIIYPRAMYRDPFRRGDNKIVMCDAYNIDGTPVETNTRMAAKALFDQKLDEEPWYGMEQEYTLFDLAGRPWGWPSTGFPAPQGPYYCGVGADRVFGRQIVESHYRACLYAGVTISGINGEVMAGQWEYQIGPCEGIKAGDDMYIARYLMHRLSELYGCTASFEPKPISGDWNGAGCHCNFSTKAMREKGGLEVIKAAIEKLSHKHVEHIAAYGEGNDKRLTGAHETAAIDKFSSGVGNRGASIRIPTDTNKDGKGYFEDRRPAANCDPYLVSSLLFKTCVIE